MKKYWINYYRDFANTYNLYWTDSEEMEKNLPEGSERITRKEAIEKCVRENERRKYEQSFGGYGSNTIKPATKGELFDYNAGLAEETLIDYETREKFYLDGYIWQRL